MNERRELIWELFRKAKHPHPKHGGHDMVFLEEFAELIVRECIKDVNTLCKYKQMILIPDEQYKMHCLGVLTEAAAYIRNQWGLKDEPTN